jgi:histidinol-phosphatase (PHP family)
MLHNLHTHTTRCNHAQGSDREYVETAIQAGMKTLGFSDHAPYLFPDKAYSSAHRMATDEIFDYAASIRALQKEYASDIRILLGFELEYYPEFHKDEMAFLSQVSPDYLILGQHFIGKEYDREISIRITENNDLTRYVTQVLAGLSTGDFLYLAHPDLAGFACDESVWKHEYRRLCEGAKRLNIPLEINFLGMRGNRHYPNEKFFEIAGQVGNKVVFGADAHEPWSLNDQTSEEKAKEMVKKFGLQLIEKPL